ncbi:MAG: hypothetical protein F6J97_12850 [Leptolyngbya sp. SIO4C1]|nr:hypothetical protein [Leptolyngbya sp. SIO4C1]
MPFLLKVAIIAAHFFTYVVAAINIWIFSHRSEFYKTVVRLRSLPLIYFGFACFAISATYEIAEHIGDDWLYASQLSPLNRLFYSFLTAGLCLIALGLRKSRVLDGLLIASLVAVPLTYGVNGSKVLMQLVSLVPALIFVYSWYMVMRDWRVFLYLLFSNVIALGFGIALIVTEQQVLHLFVGPASAIALLILGYVAWIQPKRHRLP